MATYATPREAGGVVTFRARRDNVVGGECAPPVPSVTERAGLLLEIDRLPRPADRVRGR